MSEYPFTPVAVVGVGAIMPDAPSADAFWANIRNGRYSISDTPPERWDPALYYDPDPSVPDKTYSKIGGWVREFDWNPMAWRLPIPPKVSDQLDIGQQWSVAGSRMALMDAGFPDWGIDSERVAVIIGNAIGGEKHYESNLRIESAEFFKALASTDAFRSMRAGAREELLAQARAAFLAGRPPINEDTMPGELANIIAGRVAALFNFRGPNFTTDAACASGLAGMTAAVQGLQSHAYDAVVTGGVDRNMGISAFVKFCKIGALSATGTRPFDAGADGFVMGEGAALFVLRRLADAERDGQHIYGVIRGLAGSSDGKGKGITAPNPVGQKLAVERAWAAAQADPTSAGYVEAHGTSTRVGDAAELTTLNEVFLKAGAQPGTIGLGSVKSNIGHLKAAAGTAGFFKAVRSLDDKVLAPSLNFVDPNPKVDWDASPFRVNTELRDWPAGPDGVRRAGVSAFGFGGTNFHVVVEEYVPGRLREESAPRSFASAEVPQQTAARNAPPASATAPKSPLRGALVLGGATDAEIVTQLTTVAADAVAGTAPPATAPDPALADAAVRLAIDYADADDLAKKADKALKALAANNAAMWKMLRAQGVFVGRGPAPKVAFLYTGQGSQYVNMLDELRRHESIVADTFVEADNVMTPILGRPLSSYIFIDSADSAAVKQLEQQLLQTEITQPAVLATDLSMTRMLNAYGVWPDMCMGHSLGEYGALVAAGSLSFAAALEAVAARGHEMASLDVGDNGAMAAVFGPLAEIERIVDSVDGYVVIANINSFSQAVVGGATEAVEKAIEAFSAAGITAARIPVSHAFHTSIVAPSSEPLRQVLRRLDVKPPVRPIVANVTGEFYPQAATVDTMVDILGQQVASPVQFVKGLQTLYDAGARVFVEVGPKKALHGFVDDVLGGQHDDVLALFTNHPKQGDVASFNQALCGLYASGLGFAGPSAAPDTAPAAPVSTPAAAPAAASTQPPTSTAPTQEPPTTTSTPPSSPQQPFAGVAEKVTEIGQIFADAVERGLAALAGPQGAPAGADAPAANEPVVITGASVGLPGTEKVFDDANIARILSGQQFIAPIPMHIRRQMVDRHITRLVKREIGDATFEEITDDAEVIKLAGRAAPLDVVREFGVEAALDAALDDTTRLAIGAGIDALRDAGIPLVMRYRTTTLGTKLPERWGLPDALRDDTGVVFASAFPGYDQFAEDLERYYVDRGRRDQLLALEAVRARLTGAEPATAEVDRRIADLRRVLAAEPFTFDRRFIFRALSMGHSQFAQLVGARGPNTQVNAACASTTQAIAIAEDWIATGRCRRVVVVSADDVSSDTLLPWVGSGFLASGAAATDANVEDAATPFDRRRHGMIVGMGAAALVVESAEAVRERGLQPICEVLSTVTLNSAFHGTRLDVSHVADTMEQLVAKAERRGIRRDDIAADTMFMSHETYTPARGGSAAAEITALRQVFGGQADQIVITNTKGFTGHAMGAGVEDVVAVKALETGIVPPVPNYREPDPSLGQLNLSRGGSYPVGYALRLAAGFGSQIAMALLRWTPMPSGLRTPVDQLGYQSRILDQGTWQQWLDLMTGKPGSKLEVVDRRLRVVNDVASARPAPSATSTPSPAAAPTPTPVPAAAPAPPAPPPPPPPAPEPVVVTDPVVDKVVAIVSGMTGYPPELLDVDLDLEADLGVDTVKQAEVFAAVREEFGVERDPNLQLRDFPTLTHVVGWVRDKTGIPEAPAQAAAPAATPAAAAPAVAAPPAAAPAAPAGDPVVDKVVAIVAEMTGYPPELLDVDLDLEADLGVDTVKQAEVFAAVREEFGVERDPNLQLRDFPTLTHVVGWVRDKTGLAATSPAAPAPEAAPESPVATGGADEVIDAVVTIVAEMTGYPPELLDPDLDLEADLGVDTVKQAEVFAAVREEFGVERDPNLQLRDFPTLTHVVGWVRDKTGIPEAPAQAAAPAAPAAAAPPAAAPAAPAGDPVVDKVVAIVAEMTGYPPELLDPDLDLEADLGVDTVKQAEVFAAVREEFGVERDPNLQLRDFPTLTHVVGWVRDKTGIPEAPAQAAAPAAPAAAAPPAAAPAAPAGDPVVDKVVAIVAEMTGYPPELLDPDLDLEADLGVDTVKQAEVFAAVREEFGVERDPNLQLRDFPTLTHVVGWVRDKTGLAATSPAAPAPEAAPESPVATGGADEVIDAVVTIVAEMTGYPPELLDPDLDLEADLGVDTVKQAEVFAAVREEFGVERDPNLQLRDFPTLTHVVGWVRDKTGIAAGDSAGTPAAGDADVATAQAPVAASTGATAGVYAAPAAKGDLAATDALPRRVPVPSLRPSLEQCVSTGITLDGDSRVVVMKDSSGIGKALVKRLDERGATVLALEPGIVTDELIAAVEGFAAEGPVQGVYWLPAMDDEGSLDGMDLAGWREALRRRVKTLYATMRALYEHNPFLVSATRLGGYHGYNETGATSPMGGSVTGFTKAYQRERSENHPLVKAVDFAPSRKTSALADVLVQETLRDPGCVEVGYADDARWTIGLVERPFPAEPNEGALGLSPDTVALVTGAAGSIVSAIVADLAEGAGGGTFHLLDLTPEPDPNDEKLKAYITDVDSFKLQVAAELKAKGERATPVAIERELAKYERSQAALAAIQAVQNAGGTARYHAIDLTDPAQVGAVVDEIRDQSGRIDLLLHAAGALQDRPLPSKEPRMFDLVVDVKSDGWFNLLTAAADLPIGATVAFSSVAGRFGNSAQTDYAAANDLLCKTTSAFRTNRPDTRGYALDWTAWGGIGMATRGSVAKIMEMAGVEMLPPEAGVAWIRREITAGMPAGEVVVAGKLGMMAAEPHGTGGLDLAVLSTEGTGPMVGEVVSASVLDGITVRTTLDPTEQHFLEDHRINGTPVLPGVMYMEAFAEVSSLVLPGWHVVSVEHVDYLGALKFFRDEPRTITVTALIRPDTGNPDDLVAECTLSAQRTLPGQDTPQRTVHGNGVVRLSATPRPAPEAAKPGRKAKSSLSDEQIYSVYFHGDAYQVLDSVWRAKDGAAVGRFADDLPPNHVPADGPLLIGPRLAELCFQTAGMEEMGREGKNALPLHVGSWRVFGTPSEDGPLVCTARPSDDGFDCLVQKTDGTVVAHMTEYWTVVTPNPLPDDQAALLAGVMAK